MFRLIRPAYFFTAISRRPRLKVILAWLTFGGLVLPSAVLMSFGFSERYVLPLMLIAIPPFQYVLFCILEALNLNDGIRVKKTSARTVPALFHDISEFAGVCTTAQSEAMRAAFSEMERMRFQSEHVQIAIYDMQARPGVARKLQETFTQTLSGSYLKSTVILPMVNVDLTPNLAFTEVKTKTLDELIKLQRKPLEKPAVSTPLPRVLPNLLQYG